MGLIYVCNKILLKMLTVCIATYNGEKYIRQQLNSVTYSIGGK